MIEVPCALSQINDRYEFPDELDLDVEDGKWLSENADRSVRNLYKLHSVLVHSGGVHGGHYYAYIQPDGKRWLKFDDERVRALLSAPGFTAHISAACESGTLAHAVNRPPADASCMHTARVRSLLWRHARCLGSYFVVISFASHAQNSCQAANSSDAETGACLTLLIWISHKRPLKSATDNCPHTLHGLHCLMTLE